MSTSGSYDFSSTRNDLIFDALDTIGVIEAGETPAHEDVSSASRVLNRMLKAWQAHGLHLWRQAEAVVFLQSSKQSYLLGPAGDHASESFVETTLNGAHSSSATTIEVVSTTGFSVSDNIGIELSDGTRYWDTVASIVDSDTLTITTGLSGAASDGATVYAYTSKLQRPLRVLDARIRQNGSTGNEIPIFTISKEEYDSQPNKAATGKAVQVYYDPQLTSGVLYVWPTGDSVKDILRIVTEQPIEDMDEASNNFDFPVEWEEAIEYGLAFRLCHKFGITGQKRMELEATARQMLDQVLGFDQENTSVFLQPHA